MTKPITVLISWLKMSPLSLAGFGRRTVTFMQPLSIFAAVTVPFSDMLKACTRVETAWANRDSGTVAAKELALSLSDLDVKLHKVATFVDTVALGNDATIISSGMEPTTVVGVPAVKPVPPNAPKVRATGAGKIAVGIDHQTGVTHNVIVVFLGIPFDLPVVDNQLLMPAGNTGVMIMPIAHTHEEMSGFKKGSEVTVVVFSFNAAGLSDVSKPTATFIL